jgi:hypothetical protein
MKQKTLRLDWDALEEAFTNQSEDMVYYLDLVTGGLYLEGEGQDGEDEDEALHDLRPPTPAPPRNNAIRAYVESPSTELKIQWLTAFVVDVEAAVRTELEAGMKADSPTPAIRAVLNRNPEIRDSWYLYRAERIRELIESWIKSMMITPANAAPWH